MHPAVVATNKAKLGLLLTAFTLNNLNIALNKTMQKTKAAITLKPNIT